MSEKRIITARIKRGIKLDLKKYCENEGKSQSGVIKEALDQYMSLHESDYEDFSARLEDIRKLEE